MRTTTLAALALALLASAATAQEPEVRDLTGQELTRDLLLDALRPRGPAPPELARARGEAGPGPDLSRLSCDFYRTHQSRGPEAAAAITIHFAFNSAELTPAARSSLDTLGESLSSATLAPCCFRIEGHTDSIGSEEYNQALSRRRAESVVGYLTARGIAAGRLLVEGHGESRPLADNGTDEGRQKNRRVQVVNLGYGELRP